METTTTATTSRLETGLRVAVFLLGGTSVASLLAWVFDLGSFRTWFLAVSVPGQVALVAIGLWTARREDLAGLRTLLVAGVVGGVIGTVGYDLFRVPFVLGGLRVLAPIDSYGVLALDAATSSTLTGFTGWSYHVANGIGFGLAYAVLGGHRRHWGWGVVWALVLETATVVTPFATTYALRGKWVPIAIAYAAHLPYGLAIGYAVQHADRVAAEVRAIGRWTVPAMLAVTFGVLAVWHTPWSASRPAELDGLPAAAAVVADQRFDPEWLHVAPGECVTFRNTDDRAYDIGRGTPSVIAAGPDAGTGTSADVSGTDTVVCFDEPGVHRVRTTDEPYAGGFVIVDEQR